MKFVSILISALFAVSSLPATSIILTNTKPAALQYSKSIQELETERATLAKDLASALQEWQSKSPASVSKEELNKWDTRLCEYRSRSYSVESRLTELKSLGSAFSFPAKSTLDSLEATTPEVKEKISLLSHRIQTELVLLDKSEKNKKAKEEIVTKEQGTLGGKLFQFVDNLDLTKLFKMLSKIQMEDDQSLDALTRRKMELLKGFLKLQRALENRYPETLKEFANQEFTGVLEKWVNPYKDAWGIEFVYIGTNNTCRLSSAGKDKKFGTPDDISFQLD